MAPLVAVSPDQIIQDVQKAPKNKGVDPGPIDGVMGTKTRSAIREFQESNHLEPTGALDEKTQQARGVKMDMPVTGYTDRG